MTPRAKHIVSDEDDFDGQASDDPDDDSMYRDGINTVERTNALKQAEDELAIKEGDEAGDHGIPAQGGQTHPDDPHGMENQTLSAEQLHDPVDALLATQGLPPADIPNFREEPRCTPSLYRYNGLSILSSTPDLDPERLLTFVGNSFSGSLQEEDTIGAAAAAEGRRRYPSPERDERVYPPDPRPAASQRLELFDGRRLQRRFYLQLRLRRELAYINTRSMGTRGWLLALDIINQYFRIPEPWRGLPELETMQPFLRHVQELVGEIDLVGGDRIEIQRKFSKPLFDVCQRQQVAKKDAAEKEATEATKQLAKTAREYLGAYHPQTTQVDIDNEAASGLWAGVGDLLRVEGLIHNALLELFREVNTQHMGVRRPSDPSPNPRKSVWLARQKAFAYIRAARARAADSGAEDKEEGENAVGDEVRACTDTEMDIDTTGESLAPHQSGFDIPAIDAVGIAVAYGGRDELITQDSDDSDGDMKRQQQLQQLQQRSDLLPLTNDVNGQHVIESGYLRRTQWLARIAPGVASPVDEAELQSDRFLNRRPPAKPLVQHLGMPPRATSAKDSSGPSNSKRKAEDNIDTTRATKQAKPTSELTRDSSPGARSPFCTLEQIEAFLQGEMGHFLLRAIGETLGIPPALVDGVLGGVSTGEIATLRAATEELTQLWKETPTGVEALNSAQKAKANKITRPKASKPRGKARSRRPCRCTKLPCGKNCGCVKAELACTPYCHKDLESACVNNVEDDTFGKEEPPAKKGNDKGKAPAKKSDADGEINEGSAAPSRAQVEYNHAFPHGCIQLSTMSIGRECGFCAVIRTMEAMHPGVRRPSLQDLEDVFRSPEYQALSGPFILADSNDFHIGQIGSVLHYWGTLYNLNLQVGYVGNGIDPQLVPHPNEDPTTIVWIYNDDAEDKEYRIPARFNGLLARPNAQAGNGPQREDEQSDAGSNQKGGNKEDGKSSEKGEANESKDEEKETAEWSQADNEVHTIRSPRMKQMLLPRPSPPSTAFEQFAVHLRKQMDEDSYPASQIVQRIRDEWNSLSEEVWSLWDRRYREGRMEYDTQMKLYTTKLREHGESEAGRGDGEGDEDDQDSEEE